MTRPNVNDGSRQIRSVLNRTKPARRSSVAKKARTVAQLLQVPVELLCEIAGYLKPEDLLKLARTCKALRQRFMNRESAVIWRRARRNVNGLPEPPSYLSEPAYAFFMFERRCYGCYRSLATQNIDKTFWRLAKRYCSACRKMVVPHDWTAFMITDKVRNEFPEFLDKQFLTTEEGEWSWSGSTSITTKHLYHMPEVRAFTLALKALQSGQAAKQEFVRGRVAIVQERVKYAKVLQAFVQSQAANLKRQSTDTRRQTRIV